MQKLSRGLPVLLRDSFSKFLIQFVGLEFSLPGCWYSYRKEAASRIFSIIYYYFNVWSDMNNESDNSNKKR